MAKYPFTTKDKDGSELSLAILKPSSKIYVEAQKIYNQVFAAAANSGAYLRDNISKLLIEKGLWDDSKQTELESLTKRINDGERKLAAGGIPLLEARAIALDIRKARVEQINILADRHKYDAHTAESQAENARFNYLVSSCVVYNDTGKPYFQSYDDYLDRAEEQASVDCATKFSDIFYNLSENFEHVRPENKFLKKYGFVDDKLRFINKNKELVDVDGRLVDEDGRYIKYIDGEKRFVDIDGNEVDQDGNYVVDFKPFLDDEGNPVEEPTAE